MKKTICYKCNKEIEENQKYTLLKTCQGIKDISEQRFHLDCWTEFVNESFNKKLKIIQEKVFEKMNQDPLLFQETLKQKSQSRFNELIKKEESNESQKALKEFSEELLARLDRLSLSIEKL